MDLSFLPAVNAGLNGLATIFLILGFIQIKRRNIPAHKKMMISAFVMSGLFLVFYVIHYIWRAAVEGGTHTAFAGEGWVATFYYVMLISHIILAIFVPFIAVRLLWLGWHREDVKHRRLARIGFPIWLYVSITGILVYFMLYQWF